MDKKELEFILQEGEGLKIEFKESISNIDKEMVAFANTTGGRIFLGISDDNKVKGIRIDNKLKSQIHDIANNCDPAVKITLKDIDNVLMINVEEGKDKPHKCSSGFYLRQGPNSQKLSRDEILAFAISQGKVRFDEQICDGFDFDENKFDKFVENIGVAKTISKKNILINLGLAKPSDNTYIMNNAALLFFGKNISLKIRQNFITCVLYKGTNKTNIIDRKDFSSDLLTNYNDAFNFLKQSLKLRYVIDDAGPRKEIPEIPYEALREALLNAIIHRDYFEDRTGIFVEIYDDRVEITNPGGLVPGLTKDNFGKISLPRNPLI